MIGKLTVTDYDQKKSYLVETNCYHVSIFSIEEGKTPQLIKKYHPSQDNWLDDNH